MSFKKLSIGTFLLASVSANAQVGINPPIVKPPINPPDRLSALEASDKNQNLQISNLNSTVLSLRNQVGTQQLLIDSLTKRMAEVEKRLGIGAQQSFVINSPSIGLLDTQRISFKGMVDNSTVAYVEMAYVENPTAFKQCSEVLRSATFNRSAVKVAGEVVNKALSGNMVQLYIKKVSSCSLANIVVETAELVAGSIGINETGTEPYRIKGYAKGEAVYVNPKAGSSVYEMCIKAAKIAIQNKWALTVSGTSTKANGIRIFQEVQSCKTDGPHILPLAQ